MVQKLGMNVPNSLMLEFFGRVCVNARRVSIWIYIFAVAVGPQANHFDIVVSGSTTLIWTPAARIWRRQTPEAPR